MNKIKRQQGFSMIEMIVVLVITIILTVIAVPQLTSYLQENEAVATNQALFYALQYARSEAIKRNTTIYVSFVTGSSWCYGINPNAVCSCNVANSCTLGSTSALSSHQITLSATGLTNNALHFEPNHGAAYAISKLTFTTAKGTAMTVEVGLLGSLLACSAQMPGYQTCP